MRFPESPALASASILSILPVIALVPEAMVVVARETSRNGSPSPARLKSYREGDLISRGFLNWGVFDVEGESRSFQPSVDGAAPPGLLSSGADRLEGDQREF